MYVVATPIGNLSDLSPRAAQVIRECDLVVAEDTRVTIKLLHHLGVSKPMISCHRHNEDGRARGLAERMAAENLSVALCSDAGTPAISDPGQFLVDEAWAAGVRVEPVPGPSAVTAALSASGFDARRFAFFGFLPRETKAVEAALAEIAAFGPGCAVLYESPHRVVRLMEAVARVMPEVRAAAMCDLTKKFEWIARGKSGEVLDALRVNPNVEKGEYCVVLELAQAPARREEARVSCEAAILLRMLEGESFPQACGAEAEARGRNEAYRAKLRIKTFLQGMGAEV